MQSVSPPQGLAHAVAPHTYGVHATTIGVGQWPAPSQLVANVAFPLLQLGAMHCDAGYEQDALPVHDPPQSVPDPVQMVRVPCGWPDVTVLQVPSLPATSQAWHWLVHAVSQQ